MQIVVAVTVVVVIVTAISLASHKNRSETWAHDPLMSCPSARLSPCADVVARVWQADARHLQLPTITAPAELRFDRAFVADRGKPPAVFFVFQTFVDGAKMPTEISVRMAPATSEPFDPAHRGGKLRHLPSGRAYLDLSNSTRSGPFVEQLGGAELVVSWTPATAAKSLRTSRLALLDSATKPS